MKDPKNIQILVYSFPKAPCPIADLYREAFLMAIVNGKMPKNFENLKETYFKEVMSYKAQCIKVLENDKEIKTFNHLQSSDINNLVSFLISHLQITTR